MKRCQVCSAVEDQDDVLTCGSCGEGSWEAVTDVSPVSRELLDLQEVRSAELPKRRGVKAPKAS